MVVNPLVIEWRLSQDWMLSHTPVSRQTPARAWFPLERPAPVPPFAPQPLRPCAIVPQYRIAVCEEFHSKDFTRGDCIQEIIWIRRPRRKV
jgi:hypothetical protein